MRRQPRAARKPGRCFVALLFVLAAGGVGPAVSPAVAGDVIRTVAGGGTGGDGGAATAASLDAARGVAVTPDGGFLIGDHTRVRKVDPDGTITTLVSGLFDVMDVSATPDGGALVAEWTPNDVKRISAAGVVTATIPATKPLGVTGLADGSFYLAEYGSCNDGGGSGQVRKVGADNATDATYTGIGCPSDVSVMTGGGFLAADLGGCRVFSVSSTGTASSVAGDGNCGFAGDGGTATSARLNRPQGVVSLASGGFLVSDRDNGRVRRVSSEGTITTIAGSGGPGQSSNEFGDGCPATRGWIEQPLHIDVTASGAILLSDHTNGGARIREVKEGPVTAAPTVGLSATPNPALTGDLVSFDAASSVDACGSPLAFEWDLDGNGSFERDTGSSAQTDATYPDRGSRVVRVRVTGTGGVVRTGSLDVGIRPAPPPGLVGISINGGAQFTNDPQVQLHVVWPAFAQELVASNDGGFGDAHTSALHATIPWTLASTGPERLPKTVYARFDDNTQTFQDDIVLDETAPVVQQATATRARAVAARITIAAAKRRAFRVRTRAKDNLSGVARLQLTTNKHKPGRALHYKPKRVFKASSSKIYVRVRDRAGNWSRWRNVKVARK
jgi:hypothetical protein